MRPHLHNPAQGIIPFVGEISFIESVKTGMFVGDDRGVWFLNGEDPTKFQMRHVTSCRVVAHSSVMVPGEHFPEKKVPNDTLVACWLSTSGHAVGLPDGTIVELNSDRIRLSPNLYGRSVFAIRNGIRQTLTLTNSVAYAPQGAAPNSVAAAVVEIIVSGSGILTEDGFYLLTEDGFKLLQES